MNSCQKGKSGEREAAKAIAETFKVAARRGRQFSGGADSPDVVHGLTGLHLEVKRTEKLQLWAAIDQAANDAGVDDVPAVLHRSNRRDWVLITYLRNIPRLSEIVMESHNAFPAASEQAGRQEQPPTCTAHRIERPQPRPVDGP